MKTRSQSAATRSFTIIEIMVAVIIVGILAVVGVPAYRNIVERGRTQMCGANLQALKTAFEIYVAEHNVVPGTLSELSTDEVEKAYARLMRSQGFEARWVAFLDRLSQRQYAFASLIQELGKGNTKLLMCPSDQRKSQTKVSYGINTVVAGLSKAEYDNLPVSTVVIADSDTAVFTDSSSASGGSPSESVGVQRHRYFQGLKADTFANAVTKGGWVRKNGAKNKCSQECRKLEPHDSFLGSDKLKKAFECWSLCN